jgi:hypothetical protein
MSNVTINRVSTTLTATELTSLAAARTSYNAVIDGKLVTITDEEEKSLNGIDVDNVVFIADVIKANDAEGVAMVPPSIAAYAPELVKDYTLFDQLDAEEKWHLGRLEKIRQTKKVLANEAYNVALLFYKQFDYLADAGVPGAAAKRDQLKWRFDNNGRPSIPS